MDKYYRQLRTNKKDVGDSLKTGSMLLNISSNSSKIVDNETNISSNLAKIGNNENSISSNSTKIGNNETNISSNLNKIGANESAISSNLTKLNNIKNDMNIKIKKDIYEKTFIIYNMSTNYNTKKIADIYIYSNFTTDGIIKMNANYNYSYDDINNFSHIYKFYNNNQKFKEIKLDHKSNVINNKSNLPGVNSTRINLLIYLVNNNNDNSSADLFDYNTIQTTYNDNIDTSKIDMNTDNISSNLERIGVNENNILSNLEKINDNRDNILSLKNSNIKSFYNLDKIFIYNIGKGHETVNNDNYYHMLKKEITYDF